MSKMYRTRKNFKVADTFLWNGKRWQVIHEYPSKNWFDESTNYCVVPVAQGVN